MLTSSLRKWHHYPSASSTDIHGSHYSVQYPDDPLGRDVQADFYRQCFAVKIVHHIEGTEASATDQCIMHKIDGPALVQRFWRRQWCRVTHWKSMLSLATEIQFQQAVDPVNTLMIRGVTLPAQQLEQLLKTLSRIAFCKFSQCQDHRFVTPGSVNRGLRMANSSKDIISMSEDL